MTVYDPLVRFEIEPPQDFAPAKRLFDIFKSHFLNKAVTENLINLENLAVSGNGTPVYTSASERKIRTCDCFGKGIRDYRCNRNYRQPDCNIGWNTHRYRNYFGYDQYSDSDLPVFPLLGPASRHDSHGFLFNYFSMRQFLPGAHVTKLLPESEHYAMAYYEYCLDHDI